jgi:hypothetical protein
VLLALLVLAAGALSMMSRAHAQTPGVIEGVVAPGPGATASVDGVTVQLLGLRQGERTLQEARTIEGRFRFDLPTVSGNVTYIVRAEVDGVSYLAPGPVLLSPEAPVARVEITVYPSTVERPALSSAASGVTVIAVDVRAGRVTLQREDLVVNPSTRTWTGDASGPSLRLPLSAGASDFEGEAWYEGLPAGGEFALEGTEATVRLSLRPGVTLITTRYSVPVDINAPEAVFRVTSALPADRLQVLVPSRYASALLPGAGAVAGEPFSIEDERLLVVESPGPVAAGVTVEGRVRGLGGRLEPNVLAGRRGALAGATLAFVVIAAGAHLVSLATERRAAGTPVEAA